MADIEIYNVTFQEGSVLITYSEERDSSDLVGIQRTIVIAAELVQQELEEAIDSLQEAVDKGLLHMQSPKGRRKRESDQPARGE